MPPELGAARASRRYRTARRCVAGEARAGARRSPAPIGSDPIRRRAAGQLVETGCVEVGGDRAFARRYGDRVHVGALSHAVGTRQAFLGRVLGALALDELDAFEA